jgi:hypothetical protein
MAERLAGYPRCRRYRATHPLAVKAFDFGAFLRTPRLLLLDSDVLFFARPDDLLARAGDPGYRRNAFNADVAPALNITAGEARAAFGVELVGRINSGLAVLQPEVFDLPALEEFLGHPAVTAGPVWRVEQTLLALAASRQGAELLPSAYRVSLSPGLDGCVAKHYVGAVRHLMYREGMARLARDGFLRALAPAGAAAGGAAP